jgi:hypothetical protein
MSGMDIIENPRIFFQKISSSSFLNALENCFPIGYYVTVVLEN